MKDTILPTLIVGIMAAFGAGFAIGFAAGGTKTVVQQPSVPVNYSPAQALCEDTIKDMQAAQDRCWQHVIDERRREVGH